MDDLEDRCHERNNKNSVIVKSNGHRDILLFIGYTKHMIRFTKLVSIEQKKLNLPDPQTTKTNNPSRAGPTGYFSSCGFFRKETAA